MNKKVSDYFNNATEEQIAVLNVLRKLIHDTVDNVSEEIKWNMPVFNNGKDFAYLRFSKKHITLGFYNIDKIEDPDNLLEGEGNTLKHIKIKSTDEIRKDVISLWLKQITT
ncbi:MAG: DUF1801 domain-containing protein [Saprospiraceae bacterium]